MALKKGSVEKDGTILCWGSGIRCITSLTNDGRGAEPPKFLTPYDEDSDFYDADLAELAGKLNSLMNETHSRRKRPELTLGLLVLDEGFLPVWKREIDRDDLPENYADVDSLVHLDE